MLSKVGLETTINVNLKVQCGSQFSNHSMSLAQDFESDLKIDSLLNTNLQE